MATILFRILPQDPGYGVEVTEPGTPPYVISGFGTEADAEAWEADRQFATKIGDLWQRLPDPDRQY